MAVIPVEPSGLDLLLDEFDERYETDDRGRLVRSRVDGVGLPRFVLGRTEEGCLWRFRADLDTALVSSIARLAGREPRWSLEGEMPTPPPERLIMIERMLAREPVGGSARREVLVRDGVELGEIWTID